MKKSIYFPLFFLYLAVSQLDIYSQKTKIERFIDNKVFKCKNESDNWVSYYKFDVVNKYIYKITSSYELPNSRIKFNNNSLIS